MHDNPYSAPLAEGIRGPIARVRRSNLPLRVILYTHIGLICVIVLVSLVDSGMLVLPSRLTTLLLAVGPALIRAGFLCPIAMALAVAWRRSPWNIVGMAMLVEVILVFVQLIALLPVVL